MYQCTSEYTFFHFAVQYRSSEDIKLFLQSNLPFTTELASARGLRGQTVLHRAALNEEHTDVLPILLRYFKESECFNCIFNAIYIIQHRLLDSCISHSLHWRDLIKLRVNCPIWYICMYHLCLIHSYPRMDFDTL